jgi:hypothetical protein
MFCLIGTFKIINVTTSFLNTHLKISRINEYFCLAASPVHVRRCLSSSNERSKSRSHIKMFTLTVCSKSRILAMMSSQIHVQNSNNGELCFCLPVSVNLNLKIGRTRSHVWRRLLPLNIQPKRRSFLRMSSSKASISEIPPLFCPRIYIQNIPASTRCSGPPASVHPGIQNRKSTGGCLASPLLSSSNTQFCQNRSSDLLCCWPPISKLKMSYSTLMFGVFFLSAQNLRMFGIYTAQNQ